jgi:Ras GTPase-activating-like protein IQGAP2/3
MSVTLIKGLLSLFRIVWLSTKYLSFPYLLSTDIYSPSSPL